MPASLIVAAFELSGFAAAAVTLAVHLVTTLVVSSLINKTPQLPGGNGQTGGKVQLPPTTDNKLPVVYGDVWIAPVITDVKISSDQQTMWYVLAFSETTTTGDIDFSEVYFDNKLLLFDPTNPSTIRGWYRPDDNTTVTGVAGKISMWFYKNGSNVPTQHYCVSGAGVESYHMTTVSAITVLQDANIPVANRWTSQHTMNNTVFAVMRVQYDQDVGLTGLGQIKARVRNTLKQPGDVIQDYLYNDRYGCGVPLDKIDTATLLDLNAYSLEQISITNTSGQQDTGLRYEINGYVDTTKDCLSNLVTIADSADSWIQWNEASGKWAVQMNRSLEDSGLTTSTVRIVTADQIIGGVNLSPLDLNSTYNSVEVNFPNARIIDNTGKLVADLFKGQADTRKYELAVNQRFVNEPNNRLSLSLPFCNDSVQATYIAYKRLFASREDLIINFTMDYSGIQIDAGDIICIRHDWYGWSQKNYGDQTYPGKPFRVTQVREMKSADGFLSAQITATSYNGNVYAEALTKFPHNFTISSFSGITDPGFISTPTAPTVNISLSSTSTGIFVVQGEVPALGNVTGMEFWYSVKGSTVTNNNYVLYSQQTYNNGALYPHYATTGTTSTVFFEQVQFHSMPTGDYYFRTKATGPYTVSDFSPPSSVLNWVLPPTAGPVSGTYILDNSISGSKVITGITNNNPGSSPGFFDTLGPVGTIALVGAVGYGAYKLFGQDWFGTDQTTQGAGNTLGGIVLDPTVYSDILYPNIGDTVTYTMDATPPVDTSGSSSFIGSAIDSVSSFFSGLF